MCPTSAAERSGDEWLMTRVEERFVQFSLRGGLEVTTVEEAKVSDFNFGVRTDGVGDGVGSEADRRINDERKFNDRGLWRAAGTGATEEPGSLAKSSPSSSSSRV
jgi:hypothetical protein